MCREIVNEQVVSIFISHPQMMSPLRNKLMTTRFFKLKRSRHETFIQRD